MLDSLWLVPALPLCGFVVLALAGARLSRRVSSAVGVGTVAASAFLCLLIGYAFIVSPPPDFQFSQRLWTWFAVGDLRPEFSLYLDPLSLVMIATVGFVGFLIHLYSVDFMREDSDFSRFFCYMNLFVASMLILVLADNLLLLLLGWEGVGLCSYLLIGFWYRNAANGRAAVKAFVVTRVGDVALLIAIFLIFTHLQTLDIQEVAERASLQWRVGSSVAVWAAALVLIGAVGKSAQLPLQVWLPDAMAGPTPVSALIHAATMVAAGVYLIARMNGLFVLAPSIQQMTAIIGLATLLLAGMSALVQEDIKRVLAYSTISQIGYMFLALGVGAWSAAIFHFLTHALFKSLLFLCAGAVILSLHHETNMFKMGGLRKKLPIVFWTFLVGALTLSGVPPTAGFASKGLILYSVWNQPGAGPLLWIGALAGVIITSLYTFRMFFLTFFGAGRQDASRQAGPVMGAPLIVLSIFCLLSATFNWPGMFGGVPFLVHFLERVLPSLPAHPSSTRTETALEIASVSVGLLGILLAWLLFAAKPSLLKGVSQSNPGRLVHRVWFTGWGFDGAYDRLLVRPFVWAARINRRDFIDSFYDGVAQAMANLHGLFSLTQTGNLRWYAMSIIIGAIFFLAVIIFL